MNEPMRRRKHVLIVYSQWKVLVLDEESRKLIDNAVKEDDILNENVTSEAQLLGNEEHALTLRRHRTNRAQEAGQP